MNINFKRVIFAFLIFCLFNLFPEDVLASNIFEITHGFPEKLATEGEIVHSASFSISYSGEEVLLSSTTDGLGDISLNDTLEVIVTNPDGVRTRLTDLFGGCNGHVNNKPMDITSLFTALGTAHVDVNLINCGTTASSGAIYMLLNEKNDQLKDTGFISSSTYQIVRGNWVNPENAFEDDADYASIGTAISGSRAIRYAGYNFNIPAEAEIKGIAIRIDASGNGWGGLNNIYQGTARGIFGVAFGDDHVRMGSTKFAYIAGGPDELWGLDWTPENINQLKVEYGAAAITTHRIYWVATKVYYTLPEPTNVVIDVPSFKQNNEEWANDIYDNAQNNFPKCGETMSDCACALTSATMVMKYFNVNLTADSHSINPQIINNHFKNNSIGFSGPNFRWSYVGNFTAQANSSLPGGQTKLTQPQRKDYDVNIVKDSIDNGKPVILRVNSGSHWVVVKGYNQVTGRLIINDPVRPDPPLGHYTYLDDHYIPDSAGSMILYEPTNSDYRYIEFTSTSDNHLLVVDEYGNKTGYDSESGEIVKQIPNSDYVMDPYYVSPLAPDSLSINDGVYFLTVKIPSESQYKLQIMSQDGEFHPVQVYTSDTEGGLAGKTITPDEPVENYTFVYNEETAGEEVIGQEDIKTIDASIEVEPFIKSNIIIPHRLFAVPVAVLASATFDAANVDKDSLTFGKTGDEKSLIGCGKVLIDVNRDKRKDLICYFYGDKLGLDVSDKKVFLKGKYEDKIFVGEDHVNVWKPWFLF